METAPSTMTSVVRLGQIMHGMLLNNKLDEDLKLVVVGSSDAFSDAWIARLEQDGSFDTSFGNNGKVDFLFPDRYAKFYTVVVLPDDSLLALGDTVDPPIQHHHGEIHIGWNAVTLLGRRKLLHNQLGATHNFP